jgi:FkbM family methyltransferase
MSIAKRMIGHPTEKMILKTIHGFKLHIDPVYDNGVERSIYYSGTYEAGTLHMFNKILRNGDIFIDVGSNIGLMTIYAAMQVGPSGKVFAFEPEPDTFNILESNCKLNKLDNIVLNNIALGAEDKEALIFPNPEINRGASSLIRKAGAEGKKVLVKRLDDYITVNGINNVRLMKIDIEGYELEMLRGSLSFLSGIDAPVICIEYSNEVSHTAEVGDVYEFIKALNKYRIYKFTQWKGDVCKLTEVHSKDDMPHHDNVFCFTEKHLAEIDRAIFQK